MDERHKRAARGLPPYKTEAELEAERLERSALAREVVSGVLITAASQRPPGFEGPEEMSRRRAGRQQFIKMMDDQRREDMEKFAEAKKKFKGLEAREDVSPSE